MRTALCLLLVAVALAATDEQLLEMDLLQTPQGDLRLDLRPRNALHYPHLDSVQLCAAEAGCTQVVSTGLVRDALPYEVRLTLGRSLVIEGKALDAASELRVHLRLRDSAGFVLPDTPPIERVFRVGDVQALPVEDGAPQDAAEVIEDLREAVETAQGQVLSLRWYTLAGICVASIAAALLVFTVLRSGARAVGRAWRRRTVRHKPGSAYLQVGMLDYASSERRQADRQLAVELGVLSAPVYA